ncbi:hypothetical protein IPN35_02040 [Candidatus Peregrinibacteria bacterium]|nr:MAG: hypothetical protein IPN35_02040 [Candidatus Peregrinibacteria bacterium]
MEITEIIKLLQDYGVTLTLVAIVLFFAFAFGQTGLKYLQEKIKPNEVTDPRSHAFFSTSERLMNYHIPRMKVSNDPARNALFRDMLVKKITVWRKKMLDFVARDFSSLKTYEIKDLFANTLKEIISGYEMDWKAAEVPTPVVAKFALWHSPRVEGLSGSATSVFDGKSFTTPNEMLNATLCLQNALLVETVIDAERTLGELNGELSGLTYQGLTLQ